MSIFRELSSRLDEQAIEEQKPLDYIDYLFNHYKHRLLKETNLDQLIKHDALHSSSRHGSQARTHDSVQAVQGASNRVTTTHCSLDNVEKRCRHLHLLNSIQAIESVYSTIHLSRQLL